MLTLISRQFGRCEDRRQLSTGSSIMKELSLGYLTKEFEPLVYGGVLPEDASIVEYQPAKSTEVHMVHMVSRRSQMLTSSPSTDCNHAACIYLQIAGI